MQQKYYKKIDLCIRNWSLGFFFIKHSHKTLGINYSLQAISKVFPTIPS